MRNEYIHNAFCGGGAGSENDAGKEGGVKVRMNRSEDASHNGRGRAACLSGLRNSAHRRLFPWRVPLSAVPDGSQAGGIRSKSRFLRMSKEEEKTG